MGVREEIVYPTDILAHRIVGDRDPSIFEYVKLGSHQNKEHKNLHQPHVEPPKFAVASNNLALKIESQILMMVCECPGVKS